MDRVWQKRLKIRWGSARLLAPHVSVHPKTMKFAAFAAFALLSVAGSFAQDADVAVIELKPHPTNPLGYDKTDLTVKAGQKVKLTLNNNGSIAPQPHNFLLIKPGKDMAVGPSRYMVAV